MGYTNLSDVNIAGTLKVPTISGTTLSGTTVSATRANIATTNVTAAAVIAAPTVTWTNTNANFQASMLILSNVVLALKGLATTAP